MIYTPMFMVIIRENNDQSLWLAQVVSLAKRLSALCELCGKKLNVYYFPNPGRGEAYVRLDGSSGVRNNSPITLFVSFYGPCLHSVVR